MLNLLNFLNVYLLDADVCVQSHRFELRPVRMRFVVTKVALQQELLSAFGFPVSIIPIMLQTHGFMFHGHRVALPVDTYRNTIKLVCKIGRYTD